MKQNERAPAPRLKHSLGQNFILDAALQHELAALTGIGGQDEVLEIGAGSGMFTRELAALAAHVTAVELDRDLLPYLRAATLSCGNVSVEHQDILKMDWYAFAAQHGPFHVAANLPYHITTALLTRLIQLDLPILSMHLMLQQESAEKLIALPGQPGYGPLTLEIGWRYSAEIRKYLPRSVFTPPPKVDSAFISLLRRPAAPFEAVDEKRLFALIRAGFALRRKTLLNNLMNRYQLGRDETAAWLSVAGLPENLRAEQAGIADFVRLLETADGHISKK